MKVDHNFVWSQQHDDKTITIGFTKKAIEELLPECFHVMQADSQNIREKGPMLVLETNDGLESIKAPFAGRISYFNSKARNYPDKLTEDDTILTLAPVGSKPEVKIKVGPVGDYNAFTGRMVEDLFTTGMYAPMVTETAVTGNNWIGAQGQVERRPEERLAGETLGQWGGRLAQQREHDAAQLRAVREADLRARIAEQQVREADLRFRDPRAQTNAFIEAMARNQQAERAVPPPAPAETPAQLAARAAERRNNDRALRRARTNNNG